MLVTVTDTPTNMRGVRTGEYTVQLSWSAPASNTSPVTLYEAFYAELNSDVIKSGGTTPSTTICVTIPTLHVIYNFFVVAFSDAENTLSSERSSVITINMSRCNSYK